MSFLTYATAIDIAYIAKISMTWIGIIVFFSLLQLFLLPIPGDEGEPRHKTHESVELILEI